MYLPLSSVAHPARAWMQELERIVLAKDALGQHDPTAIMMAGTEGTIQKLDQPESIQVESAIGIACTLILSKDVRGSGDDDFAQAYDSHGDTALHIAARYGVLPVVEALIVH